MLTKRGDVHVDWIISFGMFLIATILLFILLKPGALPMQDKNFLLNHVINEFEKNFTWEVKTVPLFVESCIGIFESGGSCTDPIVYTNINIIFSDWELNYIKHDSMEWSNFGSTIECTPPTCDNPIDLNDPTFYINNENDVFYLTFSKDDLNPPKLSPSIDCISADPVDHPEYCIARLGSIETLKGLNKDWVSDLNNYDLDLIKFQWRIPNSTEMWINSSTLEIEYKTALPYQQTNVYSKEIKIFTVDQEGNLEQHSIIFKVW